MKSKKEKSQNSFCSLVLFAKLKGKSTAELSVRDMYQWARTSPEVIVAEAKKRGIIPYE